VDVSPERDFKVTVHQFSIYIFEDPDEVERGSLDLSQFSSRPRGAIQTLEC
jgi:hypothetical protein